MGYKVHKTGEPVPCHFSALLYSKMLASVFSTLCLRFLSFRSL